MKPNGRILSGPPLPEFTFKERSLGDLFFNAFERHSDRISQIDASSGIKETHGSLKNRAVRAAIGLKKRSVCHVVLLGSTPLDSAIPIFASFFAGAKLTVWTSWQGLDQIKHGLELIQPEIVFVEEESLVLLERSLVVETEIVVLGKSSKYLEFEKFLEEGEDLVDNFKPKPVKLEDTALVSFTSGTTGLAKAICHRQYTLLMQMNQRFDRNSTTSLPVINLFWMTQFTFFLKTLFGGGFVVYPEAPPSPESLCRAIEKYKISHCMTLSTWSHKITKASAVKTYDLTSIRIFVLTGDSISKNQVLLLKNNFPNAHFIHLFGSTEANLINDPLSSIGFEHKPPGYSGKVAEGVSVKIVDPETEEVLNCNQRGEIRVKSNLIMQGYMNIDNTPYFDKDGFYKMGDLGYYDEEDNIYVIERISDVIKTSANFFVNPVVVEGILLEHPKIAEAAAFGVKNEELLPSLAACVVLKSNETASEEEIKKFAYEKLSQNEQIDGGILFVPSLPKTAVGKVIRRRAKDLFCSERNKFK